MSAWAFGIEWKDTGLGDYSGRMKQAWLLDQVFKLAEQRGVYIMLTLLNHGAFSTSVNPEWNDNPYNAANGGPLKEPRLFVRNAQARSRAEAAGLEVVEDRCVKIEHGRFFGGLGWAGVNTKVISAKRSA